MTRLALGAVLAALSLLPAAAGGVTDPIFGYWQTAGGRAIVEFAPCAEASACGRMVWVRQPRDPAGHLKEDAEGRPLCGLDLVTGLRREDSGIWDNGRIYDPRTGHSWGAKVEAIGADRIEVRGYAGIALLGQSQVWTRASDDRGGC